jgi:[acyl-carrier-protein] S-malonyltransferase
VRFWPYWCEFRPIFTVLLRGFMQRAFVFPGQGSQAIGMGQELFAAFAVAREVFQEVDDTLGQKLSTLMFSGDEAELRLTANAQPALMAVSIAVLRVLEHASNKSLPNMASFVAGHSLGEYTALCAAGAITLADTARLLRQRGNAMQAAVPVGVGGMAALLGVELAQAEAIANAATLTPSGQHEICAAANDNAPGQVVISGHAGAIDRAIAIAAAQGFKRSIKLPVSAPFHCALMQPAAELMQEALANITIRPPTLPLIANITASAVQEPEQIRGLLVQQITGAVRWRESMLCLKTHNVEQIIECGVGTVLAGLMKRIDREVAALALHTPQDIELAARLMA